MIINLVDRVAEPETVQTHPRYLNTQNLYIRKLKPANKTVVVSCAGQTETPNDTNNASNPALITICSASAKMKCGTAFTTSLSGSNI